MCPFPSWKNNLTVPSQAELGLPCQQWFMVELSRDSCQILIISLCCNQQFQSCFAVAALMGTHFTSGCESRYRILVCRHCQLLGTSHRGALCLQRTDSTRPQATATHPHSQTSHQVLEISASESTDSWRASETPHCSRPQLPNLLQEKRTDQKEMATASTQPPLCQARHANHRWPVRNQGQVSKAPRTCFNKSPTSEGYRTSPSSTTDMSAHIPAVRHQIPQSRSRKLYGTSRNKPGEWPCALRSTTSTPAPK